MINKRNKQKVIKGWGHEIIWASNELYCGKILFFKKIGSKMSMHFHNVKDETWLVTHGSFKLKYIETKKAKNCEKILNIGDTWRNPPLMPHQLIALENNSQIIEVSSPDNEEDNFRIDKGDSQK